MSNCHRLKLLAADASVDESAAKICEVNHITPDEARKAIEEVDPWQKELAAQPPKRKVSTVKPA